ncbi:N-terminal acetyltransferase A, auxiliary subunit [Teratosphaeria nubilosa]|uniref:N-terminal acetyltransferase A, auxiliary subunit n=1 Tax=Teratosphaeria nubilosa TaxID=161662 RepID=A0A6G1LFQ5_9PEZI|nr:N-terminal acetyltransferase A, auxiliary subunit [Teratosphaeria nubilosa]
MAQNNQVLPSKEQTLFKHLVQNYETKQYKKGIKAADQILRKVPNHGDTQAMKALILSSQGHTEEAFELCKLALKNAMNSHVCWHVYGLLYRQQKNYEEAIKAYRFALRLEPDSAQILRDLALLQVHMRDYKGYVESRRTMVRARPGFRQNWTALAVGMHLDGDLKGAEGILQTYEDTLKQPPSKSDIEHAEAVLYKNTIIAEQGEYERALEHLESVKKTVLDHTAYMEMRAQYLLKLERKQEAEKAYRDLLKRNPERRDYYSGLEQALGLDRTKQEDQGKIGEMYHEWASQSERIDFARRIPLDFKSGDAFRQHADKYLRRMFTKGVPSTFATVKQLYSDPAKKETIQELVEGYAKEEPQVNGGADQTNGSTDGSHKSNPDSQLTWHLSVNYFLAQHYNYPLSRDLAKAQQYSEKTISLNPSKTDYTYNMTRARILKNQGAIDKASEAMNGSRKMDLKDRYINTKCAKYQLRNNQNQDAVNTMGLFTRKDAVGGPLGDLLEMQCVWYITEDGESYRRQGNLALALKRFKAVYDIFETWYDDQFDFHTFSLRKGMVRAYVDMVRWEDRLRDHPFFTRAALSAIQIYLMLHDKPDNTKSGQVNGADGESAADKKKAAKKAKKEAEKAEAERKAAAAKKPQPTKDEAGETKREDQDPLGLEAFKTSAEKPLDEAMKFVQPLLELSPKNVDAQVAGFEVYIRRGQYLPALKCLLATSSLNSEHPKVHEQGGRFKLALDNLKEPLPEQVKKVIDETYLAKFDRTKSLEQGNDEYLQKFKHSAPHVQSVVRLRHALKPQAEDTKKKGLENLLETLKLEGITLRQAQDGLEVLGDIQAGAEAKEAYAKAARAKWPEATAFTAQA